MSGKCVRRRLRQKTSVVEQNGRIISSSTPHQRNKESVSATLNQLQMKAVNSLYHYWWRKKEGFAEKDPDAARALISKYMLKGKRQEEKLKILRKFLAAYPTKSSLIEAYIQQFCAQPMRHPVSTRLSCGSSAFWTWQGSWGDIDFQSLPAAGVCEALLLRTPSSPEQTTAMANVSKIMSGLSRQKLSPWQSGDPEADMKSCDCIARLLVQHAQVMQLVVELQGKFEALSEGWPVQHCAWSLELCSDTWKNKCRMKVHAHMAVVFTHKTNLPVNEQWTLLGSKAHRSGEVSTGVVGRGRNSACALYYCQAAKVGRIRSWGTHEPFVGYGVNPLWIFGMVQSGKMVYANARADMCRIPNGLVRNLESLDKWHQEQNRAAIAKISLQFEQGAVGQIRPWKEYPLVKLWEEQYAQARLRYGFLVLDGPSRMGKTQYARNLSQAPGRVLELNMAGCAKVDLRLYDPLVHDVLLFDECDPRAVLENKKLFQAGGAGISMQTSATNVHAFTVCVAEKKFVVCSNNWWCSVKALAWEDAEWLRANSYYLHVTSPMWLDEFEPALPISHGD